RTTAPPPPVPSGRQPALAAVSPASLASPQALEQRLADLRFDVTVDGKMDDSTKQALIAFQKLNGLPRTGQPTPDVTNALATANAPAPLKPDGGATRVEIDLGRQVLFLYTNGTLAKILPVSTGTGKRYCDEGKCGTAVTPRGSYRIERRITGWRKSDLGRLYNPMYFKGGIAIHGFPSVPTSPASHGCVRIPMSSANAFPSQVPDGTPVFVV
ncbi:MAG: murein L,D-transpeptidase, partial [Actinobacteria bacterium]|nr:murein L,D-transpeptidase [Actinomycetota bacterium]